MEKLGLAIVTHDAKGNKSEVIMDRKALLKSTDDPSNVTAKADKIK